MNFSTKCIEEQTTPKVKCKIYFIHLNNTLNSPVFTQQTNKELAKLTTLIQLEKNPLLIILLSVAACLFFFISNRKSSAPATERKYSQKLWCFYCLYLHRNVLRFQRSWSYLCHSGFQHHQKQS